MSDFSNGLLLRPQHLDPVSQFLATSDLKFQSREHGEKWSLIVTETYLHPPLPDTIMEASKIAPILHFSNPEDHGWGYTAIHEGQVHAEVFVSYELTFCMTEALMEQRHPEADVISDFVMSADQKPWQEAQAELVSSGKLQQAIDRALSNRNVTALKRFGFDDETLAAIDANLLTWTAKNDFVTAEEFCRLTEIRGFSGVVYQPDLTE